MVCGGAFRWSLIEFLDISSQFAHMAPTITDITKQLRVIKKEKQHLEARWRDINRRLNRVAASQERYDDVEDWESSMRLVSGAVDDLEVYLEHVETEIEKVEWGLEELANVPTSRAQRSFIAYMQKDTKQSIQNLRAAREGYDQVAKDIAQMVRLSEEE